MCVDVDCKAIFRAFKSTGERIKLKTSRSVTCCVQNVSPRVNRHWVLFFKLNCHTFHFGLKTNQQITLKRSSLMGGFA